MENQQLPSSYPPPYMDDEITLKDLILKVKEYYLECKRNWWVLLLCCTAFVTWQLYKSFTTQAKYKASLTFMVNDEKAAGFGGMSAILGNFGIGDSKSNLDKVLALSKSMRILGGALFKSTVINGKDDFLANHLILAEKFHEKRWENPPKDPNGISLLNFLFTKDTISQFKRQENKALKELYHYLKGDEKGGGIFSSSLDKKSGIMSLTLETQSEELSIILLKSIFAELSDYYILTSVEREQVTYDILREKSDSIKYLLSGTEIQAAKFKDQNNLLLLNTDQVPAERYARNKTLYGMMYGESIKNLELADFALKSKMPYIQAIDMPFAPILPTKFGKVKAIAIGLLLGLLLGVVFILGRYLLRKI